MSPFTRALQRYDFLIDELAENAVENFGGIGDSFFEGVRFYSCNHMDSSFSHDQVTELAIEQTNEIEGLLMQAEEPSSLFAPVLAKLKSIAPQVNKNGKLVFLASWGMGPGEIGWSIRYLNERSIFEQYLATSGISETEIDLYDETFNEELRLGGER